METVFNIFINPFVEFHFLRHALFASCGISIGSGLIGVFLVLRRMTLVGDALSHAILPGIGLSYLFAGFHLASLTIGGIGAGLIVVLLTSFASRNTLLSEEASLAGFYIISLALGVILLSVTGGNMNVLHLLFGNVLAVNETGLQFILATSFITILFFIWAYRALVYECFDPIFVKIMNVNGQKYHFLFLALMVVNLVASCQALGTLMSLGLMILPALTARLWGRQVWELLLISIGVALVSCYIGLVCSYYFNWPSGPTIILICGLFYVASLMIHTVKKEIRH